MQENGNDTRDRYKYKKAIRFWKTIRVKIQTLHNRQIKELIKLMSRQTSKQANMQVKLNKMGTRSTSRI